MKKVLYLVRGCPSSGKSTLCKDLAKEGDVVIAADDFFYENGVYNFDRTKLGQAHKECQERCEAGMLIGLTIFVNNTFTTEKELKPYQELADKYEYRCYVLIVEKRHTNNNSHNVPEDTIIRMENNLRSSIKLI